LSVFSHPIVVRAVLCSVKRLYYISDAAGDRALHGLINLARAYPKPDELLQNQVERFTSATYEQHPAVGTIRRMFRELHPNYVQGLVLNLFRSEAWDGFERRRDFAAQHGFDAPVLAVFSPLDGCNLKCYGCYSGAYEKDGRGRERVDYATLDRALAELRSFGTNLIVWTGGEPMMIWDDLYRLMSKYDDLVYLMYTNGTLITEQVADQMRELGNIAPAISLEGNRELTTERRGCWRGKPVWDRVMDAMHMLHGKGVFAGYSVTYTSRNTEYVASDEFIESMMDAGCFFGYHFMYVPVGASPDFSLVPSPEQRDMMRAAVWRWLTEKGFLSFDFWNCGPLTARTTDTSGCIAADRYLHFNHRGEPEPCVFCKYTMPGMNLKTHTVLEVLKSPLFAAMREYKKREPSMALLPCCFMDRDVLKHAVEASGAVPTEEGQRVLDDDFREDLLLPWRGAYSQLAHEAWNSGAYDCLRGVIGTGLVPEEQLQEGNGQPEHHKLKVA